MITSIIDAISVALYEEFGYENHSEKVEQGLIEPCFFIACINHSMRLFFGKRYLCNNQFCIQYFPKCGNAECNLVAERLLWTLEYITVEDSPYRGSEMKSEIVDGTLNFFVDYNFFIYRNSQQEVTMEEISTGINVKEE